MQGQQPVGRGRIEQLEPPIGVGMGLDMLRVAHLAGVAGDHHELRGRDARDGHIRLDSAARIQKLRVDRGADRHIHLRAADPVQGAHRIRPLHQDLGIHGLIQQHGGIARGQAFSANLRRPRLPADRWRALPAAAEMHRHFPADPFGERRARLRQPIMQRHAPDATRAGHLPAGPVQPVMKPQRLRRAGGVVAGVALEGMRAHGLQRQHRPTWGAVDQPFGHGQPDTAGIQNAVGVHPCGDEHATHLGTGAQIGAAIGREAFGAVEERLDPQFGQRRKPGEHALQFGLDVLHVERQFVEFEIRRDASFGIGLAQFLEPADQQLARVFLEIKPFLGNVQDRLGGGQPDQGFGDDVEMFSGVQRDGDAVAFGEQMAPHAAGDHHLGGGDDALVRLYPGHAAIRQDQPVCRDAFEHRAALRPGPLGQRHGHIQRVHLPV